MNISDFKYAMQRGLGRCFLELKNSEDIEKYRSTVLWGCLHQLSYDTQCEGTRSEYLYRLISFFPDKEYFIGKVVDKYRSVSGRRSWLFNQLTELLVLFAHDGYQSADDSLSEKYDTLYHILLKKKSFKGYDYQRDLFQYLTVTLMDNRDNDFTEKVIFDYGNLFLKNKHYDIGWFDWLIMTLKEKIGKSELLELLKTHEHIPEWKSFSDSYLPLTEKKRISLPKEKQKIKEAKEQKVTAEELKNAIDGNVSISPIAFFRNADDLEKKKLADFIEKEDDPEKKTKMLEAIWRWNYSGDHEKLIGYAESENEGLSRAAVRTLSNSRSEAVYRYAKERFLKNRADSDAITILLMNYHESDKELLLSAMNDLKIDYENESGWHWIVGQINDVGKKGVALPREFFVFIYENSLCSNCREDAVRYMAEHNWLTPEMIEECRYDSNNSIMAYMNEIYKKYYDFEKLIITDIIAQYPEYSLFLEKQFASLVVKKRNIYAQGFDTEYEVSDQSAQISGAPDLMLGKNQWKINDLERGSDYILWIKNGLITGLEGFSYGEPWPSEIVSVEKISCEKNNN